MKNWAMMPKKEKERQNMMMLLTKANLAALPSLYAQEGLGENAIAHVKLFDPCGRWTLYLTEYDPAERIAFGFVVSPLGPDCDEVGYASITEIEGTRGKFGLPMERDRGFKGCRLIDIPEYKASRGAQESPEQQQETRSA